jgi:hypothetical protein
MFFSSKKDPINQFPTTYFIGANGLPLCVISGSVSEEELLSKLDEAISVN